MVKVMTETLYGSTYQVVRKCPEMILQIGITSPQLNTLCA